MPILSSVTLCLSRERGRERCKKVDEAVQRTNTESDGVGYWVSSSSGTDQLESSRVVRGAKRTQFEERPFLENARFSRPAAGTLASTLDISLLVLQQHTAQTRSHSGTKWIKPSIHLGRKKSQFLGTRDTQRQLTIDRYHSSLSQHHYQPECERRGLRARTHRDIAALASEQETDNARDFFWSSDPLHRDLVQDVVERLFFLLSVGEMLVKERRIDGAYTPLS